MGSAPAYQLSDYLAGTVLAQMIKYGKYASDLPDALGGSSIWDKEPAQAVVVLFKNPRRARLRPDIGLNDPQPFSFDEYWLELDHLSTALRNKFSSDYQIRLLTLDGEPCCILGVTDPNVCPLEESLLSLRFQELRKAVRISYHIEYTIYVGDVSIYPLGIPMSYNSAKFMRQYDILMQSGRGVLISHDIHWRQPNSALAITLERKYNNSVSAMDLDSASQLAAELLELDAVSSSTSCITIKDRLISRLETVLETLGIPYDGSSAQELPVWESFSNILFAQTIQQFREILPVFFDHAKKYYDDVRLQCSDQVLEYIRRNYRDPGLSAESICSVFNISYQKLKSILQQNTSSGLLDYIHGFRIHEAKRLLTESPLKIESIAREVGYLSARTFNRAFMRYENMTPKDYRKLYTTGSSA